MTNISKVESLGGGIYAVSHSDGAIEHIDLDQIIPLTDDQYDRLEEAGVMHDMFALRHYSDTPAEQAAFEMHLRYHPYPDDRIDDMIANNA